MEDKQEVFNWLFKRFDGVTIEEIEKSNIASLYSAMKMETECALCNNHKLCKHSRAMLIPIEVIQNGKRVKFGTMAKLCSVPRMQETEWSKENALIPKSMWDMTFSNFRTDFALTERRGQRLAYFKQGVMNLCEKNFGVILGGNVGAGKTHLAVAYGIKAIEKGKSVLFYTSPSFFDALRKDYNLLEQAQKVDVLILDDCGTERSTDWSDERMFMLVDSRTVARKPIVITTNAHSMEELQSLITVEGQINRGERIVSRLTAHTKQFWLNEELDYRKNPNINNWMAGYSNY